MTYAAMITDATGVTDPEELAAIEQSMRDDIFHSTLDWQTARQFNKGAREAKALLDYKKSPEWQAYLKELQEP